MKFALAVFAVLLFSAPSVAQTGTRTVAEECACESQVLPATLAIVNGVSIGARDIEKSTGELVRNLQRQVVEARKRELDLIINSRLLAAEATKRGVTTAKLLELEVVTKIKPPTTAEAQVFFDQNKTRIQRDFASVKEDILQYLTEERQRVEAKKFADGLRAANDTVVKVTDAAPARTEAERAQVLATINGAVITAGDLEDSLEALISNVQEQVYEIRRKELELNINDILLAQEAARRKVTTSTLLEAELKPKQITEEQARLFFEQNKERVSGDFAQTKSAIMSYLQTAEIRIAERAFVEKLRASASVEVLLKKPESPVFGSSPTNK
jgi:hypothetical protein